MTDTSWCSLLFQLVTLKARLCNNCLLLEQKIVLSKICLNAGSCVCQSKILVTQLCQVSAATPLPSSFKFSVLTFVHSYIPFPAKHLRWFSFFLLQWSCAKEMQSFRRKSSSKYCWGLQLFYVKVTGQQKDKWILILITVVRITLNICKVEWYRWCGFSRIGFHNELYLIPEKQCKMPSLGSDCLPLWRDTGSN